MKKSFGFALILTAAVFLAGCSNQFEPTESTIFITSEGAVKSAIMESFEKAYYDFEELSEDVEKEVKTYCLDVNEDVITAIADLAPLRVVFRDSCFSDVPLKMNLFELFKQKCGWSEEVVKNRVHVI